MKNKPTIAVAAIAAAFAAIMTLAIFRSTQTVRAQDQQPLPTNDRISFGMVGITSGQTLRVNVANSIMPNDVSLPPGPSRVVMSFRYGNGNAVRDSRTGQVVRRIVELERGNSAFLDLDYDQLPPGPVRAQIRPVVVVQQPLPVGDMNAIPYDSAVPSVEVINNANGRTQFAVFTHPAVARGFNPQPDPPSPSE